jgi:hypothetical protein
MCANAGIDEAPAFIMPAAQREEGTEAQGVVRLQAVPPLGAIKFVTQERVSITAPFASVSFAHFATHTRSGVSSHHFSFCACGQQLEGRLVLGGLVVLSR